MQDLVFTNVRKAFGSKVVLRNLSLRLPAGEISCIMAPSGAGKTTLLRLLLGLETLDAGSISGAESVRFGVVFQEDRLLPWGSAAGNILAVNPHLNRTEVLSAMEEVGLSGCAGTRASDLSGGMARRVALLRALLSQWDVLVLDEPFKGLDDEAKSLAVRAILQRRHGRTVVLVTHDAREAEAMGARCIPLIAEAHHG